ncbi:MAG TPA: heat-inducible transcriptional repressor HrcA [Balneolales bacterium]|nr:heat-inducible transcriptional repressor HrcA [Balneolales bacterium]
MDATDYPDLTKRERDVLQYVIQNFIITANPIASKTLVKKHKLPVSSATVRNAMNNLEQKGYLDHPHTSAGRIPTELGYRFYVNSLMQSTQLSVEEKEVLDQWEEILNNGMDDAVQSAARILAKLSNLLAVIISPKYANGIFRKIELVSLSSTRLMVIITIESGLARTVNVEVESELTRDDLDKVSRILNERLSGYKLSEISNEIEEMLADYESHDETGLIRVFIDSADTIFEDHQFRRFHFGGVEYIAMLPEFSDLSNFKSIIELVEDEDLIIHLFDSDHDINKVKVRIGRENKIQQIEQCSVVSANYAIGNIKGTIGLVGPTRMNYPRMINLVEQLAYRFKTFNKLDS